MVERHASLLTIETIITIIIMMTMFDNVHSIPSRMMMLKISQFVLGPSGIDGLALAGSSEPINR